MKNYNILFYAITLLLSAPYLKAQVSVGHNDPKSAFDVKASNKANPLPTDGILIPRVEVFPDVEPDADQNGMLVFLSAATNNYKKGLHYWEDATKKWIPYGSEFVDGYNQDLEDLSYAKQANANGVDVVIQDNGRIGMGTDNPEESLEIKLPGDNGIQISSVTPPNAPNIIFYTANGTFSSKNFLTNNNPISGLTGKVWAGSGKSGDVANINMLADGTHSSGNLPTKYNLSVTGNGQDTEDDNGIEMTLRATGRVGIGTQNPSASLQLKAGTALGNSAPLKVTAGTNLAIPEGGTIEYNGTDLFFTAATSRKVLLTGLTNSATLNFPLIVNGVADQMTVSVPGATTGSVCDCAPAGAIETGLSWSCYVSAPNTVTIRLSNITTGLIDPASRSWKVTVIQ